jgi:hypothetical protein
MNRFGAERDPLERRAVTEMVRFGETRIDTALALLDTSLPLEALAYAEEQVRDITAQEELHEALADIDHEFAVAHFLCTHMTHN